MLLLIMAFFILFFYFCSHMKFLLRLIYANNSFLSISTKRLFLRDQIDFSRDQFTSVIILTGVPGTLK